MNKQDKKTNQSASLKETIKPALWLLVLPASLAWLCTINDPFAREVAVNSVPIGQLHGSQRANIGIAAHAINGRVLRPGQIFSFNAVVGPRTQKRGYYRSPSYVEGETPSTVGGGICVVSSALYRLALGTNLKIVERHAHTRPMKTVDPGFDATVWDGGPDLKFENAYSKPVELKADVDGDMLRVSILSDRSVSPAPAFNAYRMLERNPQGELWVTVCEKGSDGKLHQISRDAYQLPTQQRTAKLN